MNKLYPLLCLLILLMFLCLCVIPESTPEISTTIINNPSTTLEENGAEPTSSTLVEDTPMVTSESIEPTTSVPDERKDTSKTADDKYLLALKSYESGDYAIALEKADQALQEYNQISDKNGVLKCSALIKEINKHNKDIDDQIRGARMLEGNETQAIEIPPEAYANVKKALGYYHSDVYGLAEELAQDAKMAYLIAGNDNGTFACAILLKAIERKRMINSEQLSDGYYNNATRLFESAEENMNAKDFLGSFDDYIEAFTAAQNARFTYALADNSEGLNQSVALMDKASARIIGMKDKILLMANQSYSKGESIEYSCRNKTADAERSACYIEALKNYEAATSIYQKLNAMIRYKGSCPDDDWCPDIREPAKLCLNRMWEIRKITSTI